MRVLDLTRPLGPATPVPDIHPPVRVRPVRTVAEHGSAVEEVCFGSHAGTHVDAPGHFLEGGAGVSGLPLQTLVGPARVLDVRRAPGGVIGPAALAPYADLVQPGARVLLRTDWDPAPGGSFFEGFPALDEAGARWLVRRGVALVGLDTPSPGPLDERGRAVHRILLGAGMVLVESLRGLGALGTEPFTLAVLPLALDGCNGSPCRAVAMLEDE